MNSSFSRLSSHSFVRLICLLFSGLGFIGLIGFIGFMGFIGFIGFRVLGFRGLGFRVSRLLLSRTWVTRRKGKGTTPVPLDAFPSFPSLSHRLSFASLAPSLSLSLSLSLLSHSRSLPLCHVLLFGEGWVG